MAATNQQNDRVASPPGEPELPLSQLLKITAVIAFGPFLSQLDSTVVNVALSTLSDELHAPLATVQWVATGYLLALALMVPLNGWLVDCVGPKRIYLSCFGLFTAASTLCGLATSIDQLITFRVLQGMAGGLLAPMAQMMIARYSGARMARMMSLVSMPVLIAPIFGPSLAGVILHVASWHWLFFLNLPVGIAAIVLASILLPKDDMLKPRRLDWLGFLLVSPGLVFLLHGLNRVSTTTTGPKALYELELLAAVVLLTIFFGRGLKKGSSGLIDLRLFLSGNFPKSAMTQFLGNAVTQGGQMLIPLYLLTAQGLSPALVGLLIAPMGVGLLCSRPFIEKVVRKYGPRRVSITGATICTMATLPFALPNVLMAPTLVGVILFIRGFGLGMVNLPSLVSAYSAVPKASLTDAATALNIVQRLGGPVSTMSLALILQYASGTGGSDATTSALSQAAFSAAFALLCLINLLCGLSAARLPSKL